MDINGSNLIPDKIAALPQVALSPAQNRKVTAPLEQSLQQDQVTLSAKARQVQTLAAQVANVDDVRSEKVLDLQNKIKANTYQVPAGKVAEKLLLEG